MPIPISLEQALFFRDQLRDARAAAQRDAERFSTTIHVLERLGSVASERVTNGLGAYSRELTELALAADVVPDDEVPAAYIRRRLDVLREARNAAVHEGAFARQITDHAIEVCNIMEDALNQRFRSVGDFMVRSPVCAAPWHTVAMVRQVMLRHSFSYLPVRLPEAAPRSWHLVSDVGIAKYARAATSSESRRQRLGRTLEKALEADQLSLKEAVCVRVDTKIEDVLDSLAESPLLVEDEHGGLLGVLTAFDLL